MADELKPCPFCGEQPELPHGFGTQYEIECDCGMARSCVQISDLMTLEERQSGWDAKEMRFADQYVERANAEAIAAWNRRASSSTASVSAEAKPVYQERMALNGAVWADVSVTEYRERLDTDGAQWVRIVYTTPAQSIADTAAGTKAVAWIYREAGKWDVKLGDKPETADKAHPLVFAISNPSAELTAMQERFNLVAAINASYVDEIRALRESIADTAGAKPVDMDQSEDWTNPAPMFAPGHPGYAAQSIADTAGAKPVAWKVVWPNGIYDLFAYEQDAVADAEIHRGTIIPLYASAAIDAAGASAETIGADWKRGVMEAFHRANRINANRQGRTAEETCAYLVRSLAELADDDQND